ncbi:cop9 signalosome complex subunit 3 [Trichoderma arundinaceum]|uniref:Cop9 signalosome complex subunit 3 n=1 Tax=Trichoderma arundinaceum TaxID=490622 RepID=A0A395NQ70_TRIAR|nr:cop9 signalosome complex subunit 3 [Trichoderma arundinaceum]
MDEVRRIFNNFTSNIALYPTPKAYDAAAKSYAAAVTKLSPGARAAILDKPIESLQVFKNIAHASVNLLADATIQVVDPATNSIAYLSIIDILLRGPIPPSTPRSLVLNETVQFLLKFDPIQIRYVGALFRSLLEDLGSFFSPLVAVELLAIAILRIDPSGSVFTSTHLVLAKLAYDANCIEPALKVLDADILFYPRSTSAARLEETKKLYDTDLEPYAYIPAAGLTDGIKSTSILEYHFIQAMVYISRRDWSKAQAALDRVIGHPTKDKGVSKIMSEGYKKWILVGLLREGRPPSFPSYITAATRSSFSGLGEAYYNIASLFTTDSASKLREEIEKGQPTWEEDKNSSLMGEVIAAYQKWQVINLRRIYRQVSISQIRQTTLSARTAETLKSDEDVLTLVSDMIESGMLKGQLQVGPTAEESYVTFHEEHDLMTEAEFAAEVARSHGSIESLTKQFRVTNERLSSTKEYARHLLREQRRMEKDLADAGVGFDSQVEDEDLMTGVLGTV